MSAKRVNKVAFELLIFVSALLVLVLTAVNIKSYQTPKKVLGAEVQINSTDKFWQDFLTQNPDYIPGWVETGRTDRVREIDPNYLLPKN